MLRDTLNFQNIYLPITVIDSWGRLPGINHGFLEGNVVDLGVYDECVGVSVDSDTIQVPVLQIPIMTPAFKGQFMRIKIKPVIPDAGSENKIQEKLLSGPILSQIQHKINYEKMLVKDAVPDLPLSNIIQQVGSTTYNIISCIYFFRKKSGRT